MQTIEKHEVFLNVFCIKALAKQTNDISNITLV